MGLPVEIQKIKEMVANDQISQGQISRETGVNRAIISLILNGKYTGDVESRQNQLIQWYREREERRSLEKTTAFTAIQTVLKMAHEKRRFALIMANAGCGKTETSRYYAQTHDNVAYYEANGTENSHSLLFNIGKAVGANVSMLRGSLNDKLNVIIDRLRVQPQLIIIDQADELNFKPIDIIRTIWDSRWCGLAILGLPILEEILTRGRSRKENYDYIYSRISLKRRIGRPTVDDVFLIARRYNLEINKKIAKYLLDFVNSRGELRQLTNIFENASEPGLAHLSVEERIQAGIKTGIGLK